MDLYTTTALVRIVDRIRVARPAFLDTFFPQIVEQDTEEIAFDVIPEGRRVAPFVSPLVAGKIVQSKGFSTRTFRPAYVKDKRAINPRRPLRRQVGELIGGNPGTTAQSREAAILASELADQVDMLTMRQELMAVDALLDGKIIVDGEGYDAVEVDFGRHEDLTDVLLTTARWGESGVSPLASIQTMRKNVLKRSGEEVTDIMFGVDAFDLFVKDPEVKTLLDINFRGGASELERLSHIREGASLQGKLGAAGPSIWTYSQTYEADNGTEQQVIDPFQVIGGSTNPRSSGVRYFGAILDPEHNYGARQFAVKSWIEKDPAQRMLLMQSAPLMVPTRPNASFALKVR